MSSTTFQYFSDIHLEFYNENLPKIQRLFIDKLKKQEHRPKYLLLPGDIGNPTNYSYKDFLASLSPLYHKVFVIPGNHEYYKMPYDTTVELDDHCRSICKNSPHNNIIFLQNEAYDISETLAIYGSTFWTNIPQTTHASVAHAINDYSKIPNFTPLVSNSLHDKALSHLHTHIENSEDYKRWIVMSHHMPCDNLIDAKYRTSSVYRSINHAFACNVSIASDPRIIAWVYGHTHSPKVDGKFYCNPVGYPGENANWSLDKVINIQL
jgi:DNA repair exonuclease SbcCD nuclease subunit